MHSKVPLKKALMIIFIVTACTSLPAALLLGYFKYIHWQLAEDPKYEILAIVQATSAEEPLKTVYLAELLQLSFDQRTNIYRFNKDFAKQKLLASPLIKKAEVKKIYPGTIYVHYKPRVPVAFLADFENIAVDKTGFPFPFKPFFTPKNLPEIYLGIEDEELKFGKPFKSEKMTLALQLLETLSLKFSLNGTSIKRIDVKSAFAKSVGKKQIVIMLEDKIEKIHNGFPLFFRYLRILRLSSSDYMQGLSNYLVLRNYLLDKEKNETSLPKVKLIDLRIPELGFTSEVLYE